MDPITRENADSGSVMDGPSNASSSVDGELCLINRLSFFLFLSVPCLQFCLFLFSCLLNVKNL